MTKLNEDIMRTTLGGAVRHYEENEPRGEYVLVVEGGRSAPASEFWADMSIPEHVGHYIALGMSKMDAIKKAAKDRGVHKNEVYREMV